VTTGMTASMLAIVLTEAASALVLVLLYRRRILGIRKLDGALCLLSGLMAAAFAAWPAIIGLHRMTPSLLTGVLCACVVNAVYSAHCGRTWWSMRDNRRT
jgi:hypothetical protein